ncbi:MAG: exopolysaccharide biosynthesis protein [Cyclobacteriaceae bacterium]
MDEQRYIAEDRISIKDVVLRVKNWILFLFYKWKQIVIISIVIAGLNIVYEVVTKPVFMAETTFVLEESGSMGGQFSSIANMVGMNLNSMDESSSLFDIDHIGELYVSNRMLKSAFLEKAVISGKEERLITRYGRVSKEERKWRNEKGMENFSFEVPVSEMGVKHDSILFEVFDDFLKKQLVVDKPDRKLNILSVKVLSKDGPFARAFNEVLVNKVNTFYKDTKTKKTGENLAVLQLQADSVRAALDNALNELAKQSQFQPSPNPIYYVNRVPTQKLQIDVEASAAVYEELVKNLEVAKISHRNSQPLIQIIDSPILPLPDNKDSILKLIVLSGLIGGFLAVGYFTLVLVVRAVMSE